VQACSKLKVFAGAVALSIWVGVASQVSGDEAALEPFVGVWIGSAVSESKTDEGTRVTARELYASVLPADNGFSMEWAAIRRKGTAASEDEPIRMQVAQFVATETPNVWRSEPSEDPLQGLYSYARMRDGTLTVYNIGVDEDGSLEIQIYHRTVSDGTMELEYIRVVDGQQVRTAKGTLTKSEE
jgi:hypothetical protein